MIRRLRARFWRIWRRIRPHRGPITAIDPAHAMPGDLLIRWCGRIEDTPPYWNFHGDPDKPGLVWRIADTAGQSTPQAVFAYRGVLDVPARPLKYSPLCVPVTAPREAA